MPGGAGYSRDNDVREAEFSWFLRAKKRARPYRRWGESQRTMRQKETHLWRIAAPRYRRASLRWQNKSTEHNNSVDTQDILRYSPYMLNQTIPIVAGNQTGLTFTSSCPPYSSDCILYEGGREYCVAAEACEECDCAIALVNFDADASTYECASCGGGELSADWSGGCSIEKFICAIAESMFPDDSENVAALFLTTTYADNDNGHGRRPAVDPMDADKADMENGRDNSQGDEADHE